MSAKSLFAVFAVAAVITPGFADVPDGHGGRTSPSTVLNKKTEQVVAPARACCNRPKTHKTGQVVTSPVELKSAGHLAWVSRANDPEPAMACSKRVPLAQVSYDSPADLKASGHVAVRDATTVRVGAKHCCTTPRCPMHPIS